MAFVSAAATMQPAQAWTNWTDITLPYTITEGGNYRITSTWNGSGIALAINASNVVVDGQNNLINLTRTQGDNGVRINNGSQNVLLQNFKVRNAYVGVHALSGNFTVENSALTLNVAGLFANCSDHFNVLNSNLTFNLAINFFAKSSSHFTIEGCNINNSTLAGVIATNSTNFDFINTKINSNPAGVLIRNAQNFSFTNCDIKNNTAIGFMAGLADNFTFTGCNLSNNTLSSTIVSSNNFEIQNSILNNNVYGLIGENITNFAIGNSKINNNTFGSRLGVVSHFAIQNCSYDNNLIGLEIVEAANFTVKDCSVNNTILGLLAGGAANFTIDGSKMTNNRQVNLEVVDSGNFTIKNSVMNSSYFGLLSLGSNNFVVQNCNISNNSMFGLITAYNDKALVTNNVFSGNGFNNEEYMMMGAGLIADNTNCTVTNNSFNGNNDALLWSVYDEEENNTVVFSKNTFTNNNYTFFFDYELPNNFTNQKLYFYNNLVNDTAYVDPSSFNATFSGPYMPFNPAVLNFNTTLQAGTRVYSNGGMIGGNYWAHPNGTGYSQTATDANHDGFADQAFNLFGNQTIYDYLPYTSSYTATLSFTAGTNQILAANQTSQIITVHALDAFGNATVGFTLNLSSNSTTGKFYSDAAGTQQITTKAIPAGTSTTSFYYKDTSAGTPTLTVTCPIAAPATTQFTINAHAAIDHLTISPAATSITVHDSITYITTAYDQYGNAWNVSAAYTVNGTPITTNTITPTIPGAYTIEATYEDKTVSTTLTVNPGALDHFGVFAQSTATAGTPFGLTVIAADAYNNTVTSFTGTVNLSVNQGTINPTKSGSFTGGSWTGSVTLSDAGSIVITASDGSGHNGTRAITVSAATVAPTPTPTPTPSPTSTINAITSSGSTVQLQISGNITASQISGATITTNQTAQTTTIAFTVTGESGTAGSSNITVPKSAVPYGTVPTIYIDGIQAASQGYSEDSQNYYVWFTTTFSTHQVEIVFAGQTIEQAPNILYIAVTLVAVIIAVIVVVAVVSKRKTKKAAA